VQEEAGAVPLFLPCTKCSSGWLALVLGGESAIPEGHKADGYWRKPERKELDRLSYSERARVLGGGLLLYDPDGKRI
jgi:hypothetical protein